MCDLAKCLILSLHLGRICIYVKLWSYDTKCTSVLCPAPWHRAAPDRSNCTLNLWVWCIWHVLSMLKLHQVQHKIQWLREYIKVQSDHIFITNLEASWEGGNYCRSSFALKAISLFKEELWPSGCRTICMGLFFTGMYDEKVRMNCKEIEESSLEGLTLSYEGWWPRPLLQV